MHVHASTLQLHMHQPMQSCACPATYMHAFACAGACVVSLIIQPYGCDVCPSVSCRNRVESGISKSVGMQAEYGH